MMRREFVFVGIDGTAATTGLFASVTTGKEQDFLVFPQDLFAFIFAMILLQFFNGGNETFAIT